MMKKTREPRILVFDIETAPIESITYDIFNTFISPKQVEKDWTILSFSAKWLGKDKIIYADTRKRRDPRNDKALVKQIIRLLNRADIIITKNGIRFDAKKVNTRIAIHGFDRPKPYQHIDLERTLRKNFAFTSNSLAFVTARLCKRHKKMDHSEFPGIELQRQCVKKNPKAWKCMEAYNKQDVLATEELYYALRKWGTGINLAVYLDTEKPACETCGSTRVQSRGTDPRKRGLYRRYKCMDCGDWMQSPTNMFSKAKKKALLKGIR